MTAEHTPGPWEFTRPTLGGILHIKNAGGKVIATLPGYKAPYKANARLIAAAPDLLNALTTFPQSLAWTDDELWNWNKQTLAAITKATGAVE